MNTCKSCKNPIVEAYYFCPNCGKKLKKPPFKFSLGKAIAVLVGSFLLPPFGLIPGIRYFLKNDIRAQIVGLLAIAITIIATGLLIILTADLINRSMDTYNEILKLQGGSITLTPSGQTDVLQQIEDLQ